ncbi:MULTISPECIES: type VI secretion system protein TssA [unclassified Serratia (in: enterobacteria)]|uniref:type VI secretion system protein TssA n=1 Tax=unclassified Serratia (in: enterobacteria) TaxID=2647522 RepID=UPI002ED5D875|nr:type VI secretion system ImpA family N-terminal domain-containing protein [Serratia sp. C2(2)]MEE4445825.1 type VI secretion system ImpA family N-terminal domain-containing protein [Serratia sp. C2(1)]
MNEVIFTDTEINGVEFDPRYSEIEFTLSEYDSETDPLNALDSARDVNWHAIREQAAVLLEQCFDLRVVLWLMRANLHIDGFSAFYLGIAQIDKQYSDEGVTIFPQADIDQSADSNHAAALGWLATSSCLHEIKNSRIYPDNSLTIDEFLNLRLVEQEGKYQHFSDAVKLIGQANTYFSSRSLPSLQQQLALQLEALERVENYANLQAEDYRLDCRQVRDYFQTLIRLLSSLEQQELPLADEEPSSDIAGEQVNIANGNKYIRSRQDVILLLDQVLDYFQNYEPSHPAPILIRRSQKMIGMDFATIVEELLPESLTSLNQLAGK